MKKSLSVLLVALLFLGMMPWTPIHADAAAAGENAAALSVDGIAKPEGQNVFDQFFSVIHKIDLNV